MPGAPLPNSLRFPRENINDYKGTVEFRLVRIEPPTVDAFEFGKILVKLADDGIEGLTGISGVDPGFQAALTNNAPVLQGRREFPSS